MPRPRPSPHSETVRDPLSGDLPARHVEIQVLCDDAGNVLTLGERECSIQRRHQKLIEESPSSAALDETTREEMEATVARACSAIGYRNAGTFEFLLDPDGGFHFIEVNCRLQVEHPVSELVTGIDIAREQVRIADGATLGLVGRDPGAAHAIEIRINAEYPTRGFAPAPGLVTRFRPPLGPGIRVDTATTDGSEISSVLRLDDREGRGLGRVAPGRGYSGGACSLRARRRRDPDDARPGARRAPVSGVRKRELLDVDALRARGAYPVPGDGMTQPIGRRAARRTALFLPTSGISPGSRSPLCTRGTWDEFARTFAGEVAERAPDLDKRITEASDDAPIAWVRSSGEHPAHGCLRARGGDGAAGGGDQRGCRVGEALRVRGRGVARQRDPRAHREGGPSGMKQRRRGAPARAEELLEKLNARRDELEALARADPI